MPRVPIRKGGWSARISRQERTCMNKYPVGEYDCFEFFVEECMTNHYVGGKPQVERWKESSKS